MPYGNVGLGYKSVYSSLGALVLHAAATMHQTGPESSRDGISAMAVTTSDTAFSLICNLRPTKTGRSSVARRRYVSHVGYNRASSSNRMISLRLRFSDRPQGGIQDQPKVVTVRFDECFLAEMQRNYFFSEKLKPLYQIIEILTGVSYLSQNSLAF